MPIKESFEQDSRNIANDLGMIMTQSGKLAQVNRRLTLEEWRDFVAYYLTDAGDVLNDDLIGKKMAEFDGLSPFSAHFKEGKEYCAIIVPCDLSGGVLEGRDQVHGDYISLLEVPPEEDSKSGSGRLFKLLRDFFPEEIARDCTFGVGNYEVSPNGNDDSAHKERARVLAKCAQALINLRGHYSQKPGSVS